MRCSFSAEELVAAYLADSQRAMREDLAWSSCDVGKVVQILQTNKVPLLSVANSGPAGAITAQPLFLAACRSENAVWTGLREEYRTVKETLAPNGVLDVMIKSCGQAPSFPYRSDNLDVLYRPGDVAMVRDVLLRGGYVELKNVEEPHKYLFRKFHAGRSVSAIHLHAHVGWMVSFLDEDTLWQRCAVSEDDPLVTVPAVEDALLTSLAHFFYEDKRVSLLDVLKCAHCLRQTPDWDEVQRVASMRGWRDGLYASLLLYAFQERALYGESLVPTEMMETCLAKTAGWTQSQLQRLLGLGTLADMLQGQATRCPTFRCELPLRIPFAFSKAFFYSKLLRDPTRSWPTKVKDVAVHTANGTKLRLRIHSQPRFLVTLSGVDGSGKTTQARLLQSAFEVCHLRTALCWGRGGTAKWLRLFTRWAGKGEKNERPSTAIVQAAPERKVKARQERFRSPLMRWGWSCLTALELFVHYLRHVVAPLLLGRVVICDRYIYDTFADWAAYFGTRAEQNLPAKLLRWLSARPQLAYWLQAPVVSAQSRSPDGLPEAFVAAQDAAYQRMSEQHGLQQVSGVDGANELSDQVVRQALSDYFAHYCTLLNAVFLKNPGQWR